MMADTAFQTPASRRSPAQIGNNRQRQQQQDQQIQNGGIITNAFEQLKPFARNGISENAAWLEDATCEIAYQDLGIVMPPIGYEADLRTFRHHSSKELLNDKEDIYIDNSHVDQGTNSHVMEKEKELNKDLDMDINLNEFGFGYRNGYTYNKPNIHTQSSLTYITHKHHSMERLNRDLNNESLNYSPKRRSSYQNGSSNYSNGYNNNNNNNNNYGSYNNGSSYSAHKMDSIEDVTMTTTNKNTRALSGGNNRSRIKRASVGINSESDEEDRKTSNNNNNQFRFNSDDNNENENNDDWMTRIPQFKQNPTTVERRRQSTQSFVSEYSNYTPEGPGSGSRQRTRAGTYT